MLDLNFTFNGIFNCFKRQKEDNENHILNIKEFKKSILNEDLTTKIKMTLKILNGSFDVILLFQNDFNNEIYTNKLLFIFGDYNLNEMMYHYSITIPIIKQGCVKYTINLSNKIKKI